MYKNLPFTIYVFFAAFGIHVVKLVLVAWIQMCVDCVGQTRRHHMSKCELGLRLGRRRRRPHKLGRSELGRMRVKVHLLGGHVRQAVRRGIVVRTWSSAATQTHPIPKLSSCRCYCLRGIGRLLCNSSIWVGSGSCAGLLILHFLCELLLWGDHLLCKIVTVDCSRTTATPKLSWRICLVKPTATTSPRILVNSLHLIE